MKKSQIVGLAQVCVAVFFLNAMPGKAMAQSLVTEVKNLRAQNRKAIISIDDLLKKYIPLGATKEDAVSFLEKEKFKISYVDNKKITGSADEIVSAILTIPIGSGLSNPMKFHDQVKVYLKIKNNLVCDVSGQLIYRAS